METADGLAERYAFAGGAAGKQRLDVLSDIFRRPTADLLTRVGVTAGMRCLDVGCGGGHVSRELATMVTATGRVVGVDLDADVLELAVGDAAAAGHAHLEFRHADAAELDDDAYDVVYARFLLTHQADPAGVLARMVASLAPGGTVVVEDIDASASFCHPRSEAFERAIGLFRAAVRQRGGNPDIGPMLPSLLLGAGLTDVGMSVHQPAAIAGSVKELVLLDLYRSADSIISGELATAAEVDQLADDLAAYLDDPATVVSLPRIVQVWGSRPS